MTFGGRAPWALGVVWSLLFVVSVCVVLRVYTRIRVVRRFAADDWLYNLSFLCLMVFAILITLGASCGFGQHTAQVAIQDAVDANKYTYIGMNISTFGTAFSKSSLCLLLLNLIVQRSQKIIIWTIMIVLCLWCIVNTFYLWLHISPSAANYDFRIPAKVHFESWPLNFSYVIAVAAFDFLFAIFPWYLLWPLQMPRREKILISSSLSFGVFAGICNTYNAHEGLIGIRSHQPMKDPLYDAIIIVVLTYVEAAISLICVGIPVCRPLFRSLTRDRQVSSHPSSWGPSGSVTATIGGSGAQQRDFSLHSDAMQELDEEAEMKLGINGPFTVTRAVGSNEAGSTIPTAANSNGEDEAMPVGLSHSQTDLVPDGHDELDGNGVPSGISVSKDYAIQQQKYAR